MTNDVELGVLYYSSVTTRAFYRLALGRRVHTVYTDHNLTDIS